MNLDRLLAVSGPFIDLRSPGEFAAGAVPGAINMPLLSDDERHQVGLTYKNDGQTAAISLGEALVSGQVREERLQAWVDFARANPDAWLYCWRGGLRSSTVQAWLEDAGIHLPRIPGGFKALRARCLELLEAATVSKPWLVLGGRTGSAKTVVLNRVKGSIDLEGLANHRGSAFGAARTAQPTPIAFENSLAVAWLQHDHPFLLLEDESRTIGRLALPASWHDAMQTAPVVILEADLERRAEHIAAEYVSEPLAAGVSEAELRQNLSSALDRIQRRLGGLRHQEVSQLLRRGFSSGNHTPWIERLLSWYYDPMYDYQLSAKEQRVCFRGEAPAVERYLAEYAPAPAGLGQ